MALPYIHIKLVIKMGKNWAQWLHQQDFTWAMPRSRDSDPGHNFLSPEIFWSHLKTPELAHQGSTSVQRVVNQIILLVSLPLLTWKYACCPLVNYSGDKAYKSVLIVVTWRNKRQLFFSLKKIMLLEGNLGFLEEKICSMKEQCLSLQRTSGSLKEQLVVPWIHG